MKLPPPPVPDIQYVSGHRGPLTLYYTDDILEYGQAAYNAGVTACMERMYEMHRNSVSRHSYYMHAALCMAKLKESL